jgi:iron complex outermembrane receptor protein
VPGIYVAERHNPSQDDNLSIRGFGARAAFGVRGVKILLDGIPQTLPDGQGQLSNVELAAVRRIEVLSGASSALYGNAAGGVISLSTDLGERSLTRAEPHIRTVAGSYGLKQWYASLAVPAGRGTLAAGASSLVSGGFRIHSAAETRRASLSYGLPLSGRTKLSAHLLWAHSPRLEDPGALTAQEADTAPEAANPRNLAAGAGKTVTQGQAGISLEYRRPTGEAVSVAVFALRRDLENPIATTYIQLDRWAYGIRATASRPLALESRPLLITAGLDAQWQRDDRLNLTPDQSRITRDQLERVTEVGPFIEFRLQPASRATISLGARYDGLAFRVDDHFLSDGDDSGTRVMAAPSLAAGVALDFGAGVEPYAGLATSFETPTTTELANRPTGPGGFNPDLEPQHALNYEVGLRGRWQRVLGYAVSFYQADVRGELIPYEVPGDPGRRFYRNAGSARHRGVEAQMAVQPTAALSAIAAYTYSAFRFRAYRTGTDTLDGKTLPGVPAHSLHASLRYLLPRGVWWALDLTAVSSSYANDANTVRVGGWQSVALRAGWEGVVRGVRVAPFAAVQNLLDARYIGSVVVNAQFGRYYEPAPGRHGYVGVEVGPW